MFAVRQFRFLLLLSSLFMSGCSHLLYYPQKQQFYHPSQVQLDFEDISFTDAAGRQLSGWWFPARTQVTKGTFVFFHGNAENMSTHFLALKWLPEQGYNYFIFDYPGYGRSTGEPTPKSTVESGHAAIRWIHKNKDPRPLIIYGNSLGGIISMRSLIDLKKEIPIRAMIADDTFSSYQRVARIKLSKNFVTWIFQPLAYLVLSDSYAPKKVSDISPIPLLIIHGDKDITVEPENGEILFKEAAEPKEYWVKKDGVHGDTFWRHDFIYRTKVLEWLERVSPQTK